jgi:homocitrate synthase NifV
MLFIMNNEKRTVTLIDTTLRDGAQAPHVSLTLNDKIAIISVLYNAGIRIFEAGIPAMGPEERNDLSQLKKLFPDCTFMVWCRATNDDVELACSELFDCIHISFPVSPVHMDIVKFNEKKVFSTLPELVLKAKQCAKHVSIGAQDATRADIGFLKSFAALANDAGAERVRIADTVGILSPLKTKVLFESLLTVVPGSTLEFHGHNDLGMATANTLTALEAGAEFASVTVNGIGERAGNAAMEEVIVAIKETTELNYDFDIAQISSICSTVAKITNTYIPDNKPVSGKSVFLHKSGIHCHGLIKNRKAYEPYNPEKTGHTPSRFCAGTHSGINGLRYMLGDDAQDVSNEILRMFLDSIHKIARTQKRSLSEDEVRMIFRESVEK